MIVPLDETAAGGFQNGLCGSRIPMHGGGEARIDVRRSVGDEADFQRTADGDKFGGAARLFEAFDEIGRFDVAVGTGGDDAELPFALWTRPRNRLEMLTDVMELFGQFRAVGEIIALFETERAMSFGANVEETNGGRENDAVDWYSIVNQGDIDGEFAVFLDEFFRAVQWIDQPIGGPCAARLVRDFLALFGEDGKIVELLQSLHDEIMGGFVGGGERRIVRFQLDFEIVAVVNAHNGLARVKSR